MSLGTAIFLSTLLISIVCVYGINIDKVNLKIIAWRDHFIKVYQKTNLELSERSTFSLMLMSFLLNALGVIFKYLVFLLISYIFFYNYFWLMSIALLGLFYVFKWGEVVVNTCCYWIAYHLYSKKRMIKTYLDLFTDAKMPDPAKYSMGQDGNGIYYAYYFESVINDDTIELKKRQTALEIYVALHLLGRKLFNNEGVASTMTSSYALDQYAQTFMETSKKTGEHNLKR